MGTGSGSGLALALESREETCCVGLGTSCVFTAVPSEQGSERSIHPRVLSGIPTCKPITSASGLRCSHCTSVVRAGVGGSGSQCPEHGVSWQDRDCGWSRPPALLSAHVCLPVPGR